MIRFEPYVGKKYISNDFKILVLGESHYLNETEFLAFINNDESVKHTTKNVVERYLNYKKGISPIEKWMQTFTKFSNVLSEESNLNQNSIEFWENIAFYNYVQYPTKAPRISPNINEFKNSFESFVNIVNELKPNIIYFWGHRLWNNFPKELYKLKIINESRVHFLELQNDIPFLVLPHPSSSKFNYNLLEGINNYKKIVTEYF